MSLAFAVASLLAGAEVIHFTVPTGFEVDRPSRAEGSFLALAFAPDGSACVSVESGGLLRLVDADRDGAFEGESVLLPELAECQGLCFTADPAVSGRWNLRAVGRIADQSGIWRVDFDGDAASGGPPVLEFAFTAGGEHGAHALVLDHDGELYAVVGNQAAFPDAVEHGRGFWRGDEGRLLAPYPDPLGFGTDVRYPAGFVARLDLARRTWEYVAVGLRNVYDVAFDERGALFAVDSDMEWDLGLPWYRPVRLLRLVEGGDYGSRAGSGVIPAWCPDTVPDLLDLGRGSPTGAVFGTRARFPERWRAALFSGDWALGKILAIRTGRDGSEFPCASEVFLSADAALPVTDVEVGPDGALWFLTGGRGARGGIFRVRYVGEEPRDAAPVRSTRQDDTLTRLERKVRAFVRGERAPEAAVPGAPVPEAPVVDDPVVDDPVVDDPAVDDPAVDPAVVEAALRLGDPLLFPVALRLARSSLPPDAWRGLANAPEFDARLAGLLLATSDPGRAAAGLEALAESALPLLAEAAHAGQRRAQRTLGVLRALELALLCPGDPPQAWREALAVAVLALLGDEDARVAGEAAVLLAHLDEPRALAPLLARMEACPQELAIQFADCAHRMTRGWDAERRRRMLAWFARSSSYAGGVSLPGYLSAMRARFVAELPQSCCAELAAAEDEATGGLDAESLALLFARLPRDEAAALFPRFERSLARLAPRAFGTREQADKDAALLAVGRLELPAAFELARKLAREEGLVLEAPWDLLARAPDEQDFELWLGALVSPSVRKRDCAVRALSRLARAPEGAEAWRLLLDHAAELGARRGRELVRMLAHWSTPAGEAPPADELATPESFEAARLAAEGWYKARFPGSAGPLEQGAAPRWSEERLAAFLARAAPRPGSADVGRAVFESAGCSVCHAVGGTPASDRAGIGPDLAGVGDRLTGAEILAAIVAPSRDVSDQYRASLALTTDERLFEGFVTARDATGIEIRPIGGEPVRIEADELESLEPSPRSPMPEGLLESRTLEEIRDLFAYLKAGRGTAPAQGWSPLFGPSGLRGWDGDAAVWSVRGATLVGRSPGLARSSYALTPMPAQDLLVEFDVFLPPGGNSGFCYRAERGDPDPTGAQADLGQSTWGSLYVDGRGTVARPESAALEPALDRPGWNHVLVRFAGGRHAMEVNGLETYSVEQPGIAGPLLGFQVHQGKPMQVRIANARWRTP